MSVREYIGARYVPVFATPIDWNSANTYEPLTIVLHEGNSYTSRQAVPAGVQITNTAYWAQTGNYNAQIEQYRQDVASLANRFPVSILDGGTGGTDVATARTNLDAAQADGATNSLYDAEQEIAANAAAISSLMGRIQTYKVKSFTIGYGSESIPLIIRIELNDNTARVVRVNASSERIELVDTNDRVLMYWSADWRTSLT